MEKGLISEHDLLLFLQASACYNNFGEGGNFAEREDAESNTNNEK